MRKAHIAEVPWFITNPGDLFLAFRIPEDKTKLGCKAHECSNRTFPWEMRSYIINGRSGFCKVDGKSALVLAAAGPGYIFFSESKPFSGNGFLPDGSLFP